MLNLFVPITKVDAAQRLVYGVVAAEVADKAGEIFDYASSKPHFEKWSGEIEKATNGKSVGNLRVMHANKAAGKLTRLAFDDDGHTIEAVAKVVDDEEWRKVAEGVYTGFSIGGRYEKRWKDPANGDLTRYTALPAEVSLVDSPCIPTATFSMIKSDGSVEQRCFKAAQAAASEVEQVWRARDGATFKTKADALRHVDILAKGAKPSTAAIAKGLDHVARLALLLQELDWLHDCVAAEAASEQDGSPIPAEIKDAVTQLAAVLNDMTEEETAELLADGDAPDNAQAGDDTLALAAGAVAEGRGALAKLMAENSALTKAIADTLPLLDQLQERVRKLEAEPVSGGPARLHVVSKEDDGRAAAEFLEKVGPDAIATAVIKLAQRSPNRTFRTGPAPS